MTRRFQMLSSSNDRAGKRITLVGPQEATKKGSTEKVEIMQVYQCVKDAGNNWSWLQLIHTQGAFDWVEITPDETLREWCEDNMG